MTWLTLILRNLRYFRGANLAVIAGTAVATAVLAGALLVGDSVRGSLRELAIQRLGPVDFALVSPRFFDQSLAERIGGEAGVIPAISIRGGASDTSGEHRSGGVTIAALGGGWLPVAPGETIINYTLADALQIHAPGESIAILAPTAADVPRDATLARRSADEVTARPQAKVAQIATEPGIGSMFNLEGGQRLPRNAWMNLADLQREIRQPRRANLLFAKSAASIDATQLNDRLRGAMRLDDYGLTLSPAESGNEQVLSSRNTYIPQAVNEAANRATTRLLDASGKPLRLRYVSVQLMNNVVKLDPAGGDGKAIHYAVAAAIASLSENRLAKDEIALNEWSAARLGAKVGDRIRLDYYQRKPDGELEEVRSDRPGVDLTFRVKEILPMSGLGADRTLTPDYPGLTDKSSIREAPAELGIKDELLGDEDEAYWKQYRAAPKLFLNIDTAQRLWASNLGLLTSIRVPSERAADFERELLKELNPAELGMSFRAIKSEQLSAASGSTDFSMLFIGFSFFLIVSAALLVAMLFRLSVEQRARQFGVLGAIGFAPRATFRVAMIEGFVLACIGALIGLGCAVGYTWLMMAGLRTWWIDAVGTSALRLHVEPMTLAIGFIASLLIAMLAIAWAARNLRKLEPVRLLSGGWSESRSPRGKRPVLSIAVTLLATVLGIAIVLAGLTNLLSQQVAFFAGGTLLLVAALFGIRWWLVATARSRESRRLSIGSLAIRTASRHTARSLLTVCLIALASFLIITVASMRQQSESEASIKDSGTGGFRLILNAEIPLLGDLNTSAGRKALGMREPDAPIWKSATFTSLRRWAGQDASCLNLTRPSSPTILGIPDLLIRQNRFSFAHTAQPAENPWTLLEKPLENADEIPVIADDETAQYILKLGIGDSLSIADPNGQPRSLRLVATLHSSIFQSELLMSEAKFKRLFPLASGFGVVLGETDAQHQDEIRQKLGAELESFAVTVDPTTQRLAAFKQVANTYLSTFQTLGSLGLLLGTIGLAVVLLRELIERRSELALLSAIGFSRASRVKLILAQNVMLLVLGLASGSVCALIGVMPVLIASRKAIQFSTLAAALAAVLFTGLAVLAIAAWLGGRKITPADLRHE